MKTKEPNKPQPTHEDRARPDRDAAIAKRVVNTLGQPGNFHSVQVRQLWEDHYRVNVLVGPDAVSTRVAHSYFVTADSFGNILAATPVITKQY